MLVSLLKRLSGGWLRSTAPGRGAAGSEECQRALERGDLGTAVEGYRMHLAERPDDVVAHNNLGVALYRMGRLDEALVSYEAALRLEPMHADAWYNSATIHHRRGRLARAEDCYQRAVRACPTHPEAQREYSMLRLAQGDFSRPVWSGFRWRRQCAGFVTTTSRCGAPAWCGEPLDGKTVLVYGEQGLGDEILFASCYPDLIASAASCVVETEPRLERLFARSFPGATVLARTREAELDSLYSAVAHQLPCGDLPYYFRCSPAAFPERGAFLVPDENGVARWRRTLAGLGDGLKVGISWRGGTPRSGAESRSINLARWESALRLPDMHFVSLQYGDHAREMAAASTALGVKLHHWPEAILDYDETAALVCALDLVITVTTSLAHLAGALGQRVWILANSAPRWRYLAAGDTMPWYRSARVFRQGRPGDWAGVIAQVAGELATDPRCQLP
jgi:tetratricopeptide (TPR) repeat protein